LHPLLAAETGTVRKKWKGRLPAALLYPNTYPLAVSNLGYQLLYRLLNRTDEIVCERFVYPQGNEPFRSLESSRPLADFPLIFCSISFEQDYPRLAAMLAAGGIAPYAADRSGPVTAGKPLVIFGGVGGTAGLVCRPDGDRRGRSSAAAACAEIACCWREKSA
jgi:hypothetical protein